MSTKVSKNGVQFYPPPNFSYFEEKLSRCTMPISQNNAIFWHHIGIKRVLNYSGKELDANVTNFCDNKGIIIQHVDINHIQESRHDMNKLQEWMALCLEELLSQYKFAPTMIIGCADHCIDCLLLACWRKLQDWSIISIIAEFRFLIWPHRLFDFEQFIEYFDTQTVSLASDLHTIRQWDEQPTLSSQKCPSLSSSSSLTTTSTMTTSTLVTPISTPTVIQTHTPDNNQHDGHFSFPQETSPNHTKESQDAARKEQLRSMLYFPKQPNKLLASEHTFDPLVSLIYKDKYDSEDGEQVPIDRVLCDLFFNEPNELLAMDTLDPAISGMEDDD